jgi:hypothetical protein
MAKTEDGEDKARSWFAADAVGSYVAVGGLVIGLVTAIVGVATYYDQSRKDAATREFEAKKPFFERQMTFYVEAMEVVGKIAASESPATEDLDLFWQIYWGRLGSVEDSQVDRAMVLFGDMIKPKLKPQDCLQIASLLLAHCVKSSWARTWQVKLDDPPEFPCTDNSFDRVVKSCQVDMRRKTKPG